MLLGVYANVPTVWTPLTTLPRNSLRSMRATTASSDGFRRAFGSTLTTVGVGGAFYCTALPSTNTAYALMSFNDAANNEQVTLRVQTSGALEVVLGTLSAGTTLGTSATQPFTAGTWHHVEMKWVASSTTSATDGTVTVNVDGVEALAITGVDNVATSNREASQVEFCATTNTSMMPIYVDDIFAWDSSGSYNNDFLGDKDVLPYYFDDDGSDNDWIRSTSGDTTGDAFAEVDETAQDGDSTYIEASSSSDVQTLELAAVPSSVSGISGVIFVNMMRKTGAGSSTVEVSCIETGSAESTAEAINPTQSYAYYETVVERDPQAGTPAWTYTTLSAAKMKLNRTV